MIECDSELIESIRAHGRSTYPNECCGVLLGAEQAGVKQAREIVALDNTREEEARHNRFLIAPEDLLRVEKESRRRGLDILGFYHSHPDAEARPSRFDLEHAWPWYSYMIVSVRLGQDQDITSWVMREDRSMFDTEKIVMRPNC